MYRSCKIIVWKLLIFEFVINIRVFSQNNWPSSTQSMEPRLKQVPLGGKAILRCVGRINNAPAHWDFKPCSEVEGNTSCRDVTSNSSEVTLNWSSLSHTRSTFTIKNVTMSDSGLYRCRETASDNIEIYSTVELQVIRNGEDLMAPKFLETSPKNLTVSIGSQVTLQCKVTSKTHPTIIWLREGFGSIHYHGKLYNPINTSKEIELSTNTYLSKLIIKDVTSVSEGIYHCLVINTKGFNTHGTFVKLEKHFSEQYTTFYLLFLMPLSLAFFPIVVWVIYVIYKRRRNNNSKSALKVSNLKESIKDLDEI